MGIGISRTPFLLEGRGCQRTARSGRGILQIPQVAPTKQRPKPLSSEAWMATGDALRELETSGEKGHNKNLRSSGEKGKKNKGAYYLGQAKKNWCCLHSDHGCE